MYTLEYYFNPHLKKDTYLKVFQFRPQKKELFHLGHLFLIVEFKNLLKEDKNFIKELVDFFRKTYYSHKKLLPEKALIETLKKANQKLYKISEKGNVRWIGNLNIAVLVFSNYFLYFSRGGSIQILLLRGEELSDIGENLEEKTSPSPLRFFGGVASGRLLSEDKVMVITQKFFEDIYDEILPELINLKDFRDKALRKFFKSKKKEIKNTSGIFFLLSVEEKIPFFSFRFRIPKINKTLFLILSLLALLLISYFIFR